MQCQWLRSQYSSENSTWARDRLSVTQVSCHRHAGWGMRSDRRLSLVAIVPVRMPFILEGKATITHRFIWAHTFSPGPFRRTRPAGWLAGWLGSSLLPRFVPTGEVCACLHPWVSFTHTHARTFRTHLHIINQLATTNQSLVLPRRGWVSGWRGVDESSNSFRLSEEAFG